MAVSWLYHQGYRAGTGFLQKYQEKEPEKALKRRPQPHCRASEASASRLPGPWLCCPPWQPSSSPLLRSSARSGRHCLPLEGREARSRGVPLTVGEPVGESPGERREETRFRAALAPGQASRRPYLHPHRWATRWTGCCQPLGSGLSRDRRHRRQGSPSRCHQWTWGAWWCWGRRRGIRWAKGGPGTGAQAEEACTDGPLCWEQVLTDGSVAGHSFVSTPRSALGEPLGPSLPAPPPRSPSQFLLDTIIHRVAQVRGGQHPPMLPWTHQPPESRGDD